MKEQAEFYRIGLLIGLVKVSDVIAWCDLVIMAESAPDIALIEASLSGSRGADAVAGALSEVKGEFDKDAVMRRIFQLMHDLLSCDRNRAEKIAATLNNMAFYGYAPSKAKDVEWEMWSFSGVIGDVLDGICGDIESLTNEMLLFLKEQSAPVE